MRKQRIHQIVLYIIITVLAAIFIYQALRKVAGHSWQIESLVLVLIASTLAVAVSNRAKVSELNGEFRHFKRSFGALASDFKEMRKDFHNLKTAQEKFNNWSRIQFNEIKRDIAK
ncbi:MAG: hypothetical protein KKE20_02745 [Nanoarchaeota archaeon]|nr:hypothetical protein [Nanoarchaeota archaeon]